MTRGAGRRTRSPQEAMWSTNSEAQTSTIFGTVPSGPRAVSARRRRPRCARISSELGAQWTVEDAESHAIAGQCAEARREAAAGLELSRDNFTLERASRTLALCDAAARPRRLSAELANRFPNATLTTRIQLPVTAAALAVAARRAGARARAARAGQAVRSRPGGGILARLPSRSGVSAVEGRPSGRDPVPEHPRPSRRGAHVAAVPARAPRSRPCGRAGGRRRPGPQGVRRLSRALARRRFEPVAARQARAEYAGSSSTLPDARLRLDR